MLREMENSRYELDVATILPSENKGCRNRIQLLTGNIKFEDITDLTVDDKLRLSQRPIFPTDKTLALLAKLSYKDDLQQTLFSSEENPTKLTLETYEESLKENLAKVCEDWKLLTTAINAKDKYCGAAFWNATDRQLVISHRGTKFSVLGAILADLEGIVRNQHTSQIDSACTFVAHVLEKCKEKTGIQISITGHSLGAWLAQVTTFSTEYLTFDRGLNKFRVKNEDDISYHAHCVGFESPGCRRMLTKLSEMYHPRYQYPEYRFWANLDITLYFTRPNMVNTFGKHVGQLYQIDIVKPAAFSLSVYHLHYHKMDNVSAAMVNGAAMKVILDWPLVTFPERIRDNESSPPNSVFSGISRLMQSLPTLFYDYFQSSNYEVNAFWEHANNSNNYNPNVEKSIKSGISLHYRVAEVEGSTCYLNVFSEVEKLFLMCCFNTKSLNLKAGNDVINEEVEKAFPNLHLANNNNSVLFTSFSYRKPNNDNSKKEHKMIECESELFKDQLINVTKQVFRFLPDSKKFVQHLAQVSKTDILICKMFSQNYLPPEVTNLQFENDVLVHDFLLSTDEKVLLVKINFNSKFVIKKMYDICCRNGGINQEHVLILDADHLILLSSCLELSNTFQSITDQVLLILDFQRNNIDEKEIEIAKHLLTNNDTLKAILVVNNHNYQKLNNTGIWSNITLKSMEQNSLIFPELTLTSREYLIGLIRNKDIFLHGENVPISKLINDEGVKQLSTETIETMMNRKIEVPENIAPSHVKALEDCEPFLIELSLFENSKISSRFVVLSGEPGMGKSVNLFKLREEMSKSGWVIYRNLLQFQKQFASDKISARDFLFDTKVPWDLINSMLYNSANKIPIFLLIDDFDKLDPAIHDCVIAFLATLKSIECVRMWVTTNSNCETKLETFLGVCVTTIGKLDEKQQKTYLRKYWEKCLSIETAREMKLKGIVDQVFKQAKDNNFHEELIEFLGTPLRVQMFAKVLQPTIDSCIQNNSIDLNIKDNCKNLFNNFIVSKYNDCFERHLKSISNFAKTVQNWTFDICKEKHSYLAFNHLFPKEMLEAIQIGLFPYWDSDRKEKDITAISAVGLIYQIDNQYRFFSQLFADYFVSDLIVSWNKSLENNNNEIDQSKFDFIDNFQTKHIFLDDTRTTLRYFINQKLSICNINVNY